jgi:hypothetical protein
MARQILQAEANIRSLNAIISRFIIVMNLKVVEQILHVIRHRTPAANSPVSGKGQMARSWAKMVPKT